MQVIETIGFGQQARRPGTYLALAVAMICVYLSVTLSGSALVLALSLAYLALVAIRVTLNPGRGFRLSAERLDRFTPTGCRSLPLSEIECVSIGHAPQGGTLCVLRLNDGSHLPLDGVEDVPPARLIREFGNRGVRVMAPVA
ncbi:hypothetical protein [Albidovulum sp.]